MSERRYQLDELDELLGITEEDHRLYAAMRRSCCGVANGDAPEDTKGACSEGNCVVWFCGACGGSRGMSAGPVGCPCEVSRG